MQLDVFLYISTTPKLSVLCKVSLMQNSFHFKNRLAGLAAGKNFFCNFAGLVGYFSKLIFSFFFLDFVVDYTYTKWNWSFRSTNKLCLLASWTWFNSCARYFGRSNKQSSFAGELNASVEIKRWTLEGVQIINTCVPNKHRLQN